MMSPADILRRLHALRAAATLGSRATRHCTALIDRLQAPVRVAVFGFPGAGKAGLVNAMIGQSVLRIGAQHCPVLILTGPAPSARVTLYDGSTAETDAKLPFATPGAAAFVELSLVLPDLQGLTVLNVVTDGSVADMAAAMSWAESRCDIAIWCTQGWTEAERRLWQGAPDRLRNHAQLVIAGGAAAPDADALRSAGFQTPYWRLADGTEEAIRAGLMAMISEARAEDVDAAHLFLHQHGAPVAEPVAKVRETITALTLPPGEAWATLSRMVLRLRQQARALSLDLRRGTLSAEEAGPVLTRLRETLEYLQDLAEGDDLVAETWPGVVSTLQTASELALLLEIEGGAAQVNEAARLLMQVRQELDGAAAA